MKTTLSAVLVVLLLTCYVGSYLALFMPGQAYLTPIEVRQGNGIVFNTDVNQYRYGGKLSKTVFAPIEWIDRRLRPEAFPSFGVGLDGIPDDWRHTMNKDDSP